MSGDNTVLVWQEGERERWLARAAALDHGREQPDWAAAVAGADRLGDLSLPQVVWLIAKGPEASARALLERPAVLGMRQRLDVVRVAVARFEEDAVALALSEAGAGADALGSALLPIRGPEPARLVAGWLRHLGSARLWARLWLARHPDAAARALIPDAAGRAGKARQNAGDALRGLASTGAGPVLVEVAAQLGGTAPAVVAALLDPPPGKPARSPKLPSWCGPGRLPAIERADGGGVLPDDVVARLVTALTQARLSPAPEPAPGDPELLLAVESSAAAQPLVAPVGPEAAGLIAQCDRASLAAWGRALVEAWLTDGMPAAHAWVVLAQAHLGDDATADLLAPHVRSWPARSRWARAIDGLAVLATLGTDTALRHLLAIEENMAGGPTNERALVHLTQAAALRGLSVTQLADRLALTHRLDTGSTLDHGTRSLRVTVDDSLAVHLRDEDGRIVRTPPKPVAAAFRQWKKDLLRAAAAQLGRCERDMLTRRVRPARDLSGVLLRHPILGPVARRVLWGSYEGGRLVRALRVAEDGSFADGHDNTAIVDGCTPLGIVHPADLDPGERAAWAQLFADYEILQPFPQLHRPAVVLTPAQRAATSLAGGWTVPTARVVQLLNGRWMGGDHESGRFRSVRLSCDLPGGLAVVVELDPGVASGGYNTDGEQTVVEIWVDDSRSDHWQVTRRTPLGESDAAALSEALIDWQARPVAGGS
ncbi:DUF4132 domain-containing protein [Actinoplanes sp. N902-109]|uniref:DUF4132 domain-containing protein n=1 Tax=Actinoplanes sp. (strain N902-109) TaxID=649831 RepID=UPI0003293E84|nr:DUF4132 domain-containing protein [Actinoplanes sp. N902-109]AGL17785.1 WGR domain-containing protein [Actinoplanes sp. N902-109]